MKSLTDGSLLANRLLCQHFLALLGVPLFFADRGWESELKHFTYQLYVMNIQVFELLGSKVLVHVRLIFRGQDYVMHSGALCSQDFFLDSADGQHVSAQGDFPGHCSERPNRN